MTAKRPEGVLDWDGPIAPPRRNGELVFDALWESRVFGMTMTLYERGAFQWDEFRERLIAAIGAWERAHQSDDAAHRSDDAAHRPDDAGYRYWDCWLTAFEDLVAAKGFCLPAALDARVAELAARPPGHDHRPREQQPD